MQFYQIIQAFKRKIEGWNRVKSQSTQSTFIMIYYLRTVHVYCCSNIECNIKRTLRNYTCLHIMVYTLFVICTCKHAFFISEKNHGPSTRILISHSAQDGILAFIFNNLLSMNLKLWKIDIFAIETGFYQHWIKIFFLNRQKAYTCIYSE